MRSANRGYRALRGRASSRARAIFVISVSVSFFARFGVDGSVVFVFVVPVVVFVVVGLVVVAFRCLFILFSDFSVAANSVLVL